MDQWIEGKVLLPSTQQKPAYGMKNVSCYIVSIRCPAGVRGNGGSVKHLHGRIGLHTNGQALKDNAYYMSEILKAGRDLRQKRTANLRRRALSDCLVAETSKLNKGEAKGVEECIAADVEIALVHCRYDRNECVDRHMITCWKTSVRCRDKRYSRRNDPVNFGLLRFRWH